MDLLDKMPFSDFNTNSDGPSKFDAGPMMEFKDRLNIAISGETLHAFSKRAGIPDSTMRNYLSGTVPGLSNLMIIAQTAGVTLDWLVLERGPMRREDQELPPSEFRLIPRFDVQPSSGFGAVVPEEGDPVDMLAFRSEWLRRVGINPDFAHVLTNKGDSNEPTIRDGDVLLVDTSIDRVIDNAFYVVVYNGQALLKRVQILLDGSIVLSSDNKNYQPETVKPDDVPSLRIAARLMWFGRSI